MLSDVFGAFEVANFNGPREEQKAGNVLLQGAPENPESNSWSHFTHIKRSPFTSLPSGTNWMNYVFSVRAKLLGPSTQDAELDAVVACGRVPVWPPGDGSPFVKFDGGNVTVPPGVCLTVQRSGAWLLSEAGAGGHSGVVIASGSTEAALSTWQTIELRFSGYE